MIFSATHYFAELHHFDLFVDVKFHFHITKRCSVVFSRRFVASKAYEKHVNTAITVKVLGEISFHVMAGKLETAEG